VSHEQCCGSVRICIIFQDPDPFPWCIGSGSISFSNGITKLIGRENLTKNTFCVVPIGLTVKENQVKMFIKYCFVNISDSALFKDILENNILLFSLASKELIAVRIVKLSLTITESRQFIGQKLS
jgi:hypothetical protein